MNTNSYKHFTVYHSSYSCVERITIVKVLQLVIERYMDGFLAATTERVQAIQTTASLFLLVFLVPFAVDIIGQLATPLDALSEIVAVVLLVATAPVWWLLRYWIKKFGRPGDLAGSV